jgi:ABC-2 type transport system permease protein
MIGVVALHEFLAAVMRRSFVWMTLGMPVIFVAYIGLVMGIGRLAAADEVSRRNSLPVGLVDEVEPAGAETHFRPFATVQDAQNALRAKEIASFVVLPPDYVQRGVYTVYVREYRWFGANRDDRIARHVHERLLARAGVDPTLLQRTQKPPEVITFELAEDGQFLQVDLQARLAAFFIPVATTAGLVFALAMNASLLLASVVEDKENKMMDVLLSSTRADDLLFGKVLGIVSAGVLQLVVWGAMMGLVAVVLASMLPAGDLLGQLSISRLPLAICFALLAFLFYGVLLVGLGSFGSSFRDSQQLSVIIIMLPMIPFVAFPLFLSDANGPVPRMLSYLPPTVAPAMVLRLAAGPVAWQEVIFTLLLLALSIVVAVKVSARLFRAGTLLYGKRADVITIARSLWEPM